MTELGKKKERIERFERERNITSQTNPPKPFTNFHLFNHPGVLTFNKLKLGISITWVV